MEAVPWRARRHPSTAESELGGLESSRGKPCAQIGKEECVAYRGYQSSLDLEHRRGGDSGQRKLAHYFSPSDLYLEG